MQILEYHIYEKAAYKVADFKKHNTLVTAEGESLKVTVNLCQSTLPVEYGLHYLRDLHRQSCCRKNPSFRSLNVLT